MAGETESLWTTIIFSGVAGSVVFLWFILMRKRFPRFYMANLLSADHVVENTGTGYFNWIAYTWRYPEVKLLHSYGGMDRVMYLKFMKYTACLFAIYSVLGLVALLPVNATGGFSEEQILEYDHGGLERYSMGNIKQGSDRLWVHLSFVFIFSVFAWYYVYNKDEQYQSLKHLQSTSNSIQSRTVMIDYLPLQLRSSQALKDYFSVKYPGKVIYATVVPDIPLLRRLQQKRQYLFEKWREAKAKYESKNKRPTHWTGPVPCSGELVDSLVYYTNEIQTLDEEIRSQVETIKAQSQATIQTTKVGFVTFTSIRTALECVEEFRHIPFSRSQANVYNLRARPAPEPHDIDWESLSVDREEFVVRRIVVALVLIAVFLFWSIPVTFISAFYNLNDLVHIPRVVIILIGGLVPSSSLALFLSVLPDIFYAVIRMRRFYLKTQVDRSVLRMYWLFLFMNVFLLSIITSSLFDTLRAIWEEPQETWKLFSGSIPKQALFFANYIVLQTLFGYAANFARLKKLLVFWFKSISASALIHHSYYFDYSEYYAEALLIFAIGVTYSVMAPIISPLVFLYFAIGWFSAKYNFIFVKQAKYEALKMTSIAINRIMVTLLFFQLIMIGEFSLKYFPPGSAVGLLVIGTAIYWYFIRRKFTRMGKYIALSNALLRAQIENVKEEDELLDDSGQPALDKAQLQPQLVQHVGEMYEDPALQLPPSLTEYEQDFGTNTLDVPTSSKEANSESTTSRLQWEA